MFIEIKQSTKMTIYQQVGARAPGRLSLLKQNDFSVLRENFAAARAAILQSLLTLLKKQPKKLDLA